MQDWTAFQQRERQMRRQHNDGEWCEAATKISASLTKKHNLTPLNARQSYRLAKRLKHERGIHRMECAVDDEPSGKAIKRRLSEIQKSIERLADFARDVEAAERAMENRGQVDTDGWERRGAVKAIARAGQRWEMCEREKHKTAMEQWWGSPNRDDIERPHDRLEGHLETPAIMPDGYALPYADVMVRNWFEQARFMKEILKDPKIAVRHLDDLNWSTAEASLAGRRMPELFKRTYPTATFGSPGRDGSFKNAAGYSFVQLAIAVITGRSIASNTIRTHIQNESRRAET